MSRLLIIFFVMEIVPLILIAKYNFPSVDDYSFSVATKNIWEAKNSFRQVIIIAMNEAYEKYYSWQGCYATNFLLGLNPIIFGTEFYFVVPIFILLCLVLSTLFFTFVVFKGVFEASNEQAIIISIIWLSLDIQFLPSAVQGFYWYTSVIPYTFFYCLSLILYTEMLRVMQKENHSKFSFMEMCILAFVLGGGWYISGVLTFVVFSIFGGYCFIHRNNKWKIYCVPFLIFTIAFICNFLAPGNSVRKGIREYSTILVTISKALLFSIESADKWFSILVIIALTFAMPVLINITKKTKIQFRYPMLISILSIATFIVQFCPHAYALGTIGPDRLLNVIYFSYVFLIMFNLFYWLGWLLKKNEGDLSERSLGDEKKYPITLVIVCGLLLMMSCLALKDYYPASSLAAVNSLISGEAKQYGMENQERLLVLEDDTQEEVVLKDYTSKPMLLFWDDGVSDPSDWRNDAMSMFFNKDSVVVE